MCARSTLEEQFDHPGALPLAGVAYTYVIEGECVSKKNSKRILRRGTGRNSRPFIASSKAYKRWERNAVLSLRIQRNSRPTITSLVKVSTNIFLGKGQQRPDRDNARGGPFDVLEAAGIIENDRQIYHDPLRFYRDWERPRVEVTVEPLTAETLNAFLWE